MIVLSQQLFYWPQKFTSHIPKSTNPQAVGHCFFCVLLLSNYDISFIKFQWRKPEDKPIPIIWFTVFLVGLFLNVFAIAVNASALCYTTPCVIFYVVNGFGVILDAAFLYFWWTKCLFFWRKWCALNQDWSIVIGPGQLAPQRTNQDERNGDRTTTSCIQMPHIV